MKYVIGKSPDPFWYYVTGILWTNVEADVAIICTCLPMLNPLIRFLAPRLSFSTKGTTRKSSGAPVTGSTSRRSKISLPLGKQYMSNLSNGNNYAQMTQEHINLVDKPDTAYLSEGMDHGFQSGDRRRDDSSVDVEMAHLKGSG